MSNTLLADKLLRSGDIAERGQPRPGAPERPRGRRVVCIRISVGDDTLLRCSSRRWRPKSTHAYPPRPQGRGERASGPPISSSQGDGRGNVGDFTRYAHGRYALLRGMEKAGIDSLTSAAADTLSPVAPEAARAIGSYLRGRGDRTGALEWFSRAAAAARDTTIKVAAMMDAADVHLVDLGDRESAKKTLHGRPDELPGLRLRAGDQDTAQERDGEMRNKAIISGIRFIRVVGAAIRSACRRCAYTAIITAAVSFMWAVSVHADKMLIPMDFKQSDHLKAYGVAYHAPRRVGTWNGFSITAAARSFSTSTAR